MKPEKPLGRKSYGSIPHLPNSRIGPGDHKCHEGQQRIACTKARNRHDRVIVTEKLDGSNVGIAKVKGSIVPLGRAGYRAETSRHEMHHHFASWVLRQTDRFSCVLMEGQRLCGEWLAQAHGTRYRLTHEPFVLFDVITGEKRLPWDGVVAVANEAGLTLPHVLSDGPPCSLGSALKALGEFGHHGALEPVEGAVWRVEHRGEFDFMVKWVRPDKADGIYLNGDPIWNENPK